MAHARFVRALGGLAVTALLATACSGSTDAGAAAPSGDASETSQDLQEVRMQLGWLAGNNQLGEVVAREMGYYAEEGLELTIDAGGPNIDGVALVASGKADIGQLSSSPSLMLASASGIPVKAFAAGAQEHPYAFISMPDTPLDSAADFAGLHVGTQATGEILLNALLAKNGLDRDALDDFTAVGADVTPLLTGQVDVWTAWLTNTAQLDQLPEGYNTLRLWDAGVQLYALPYYAQSSTLEEDPEMIEGFLRATAKGWDYARDNLDEALTMLVDAYPNLDVASEKAGAEVLLDVIYTDATATGGWGTMDPDVWQAQLDLWTELGQFEGDAPALDDVMTTAFLDATADARATS